MRWVIVGFAALAAACTKADPPAPHPAPGLAVGCRIADHQAIPALHPTVVTSGYHASQDVQTMWRAAKLWAFDTAPIVASAYDPCTKVWSQFPGRTTPAETKGDATSLEVIAARGPRSFELTFITQPERAFAGNVFANAKL